ncbi:hypothetical protein ACVC7V_25970 [Hydrogenophaga sp. A37]|uniref:hypothetical protein n=1 Tax=Hydrogenophaga sp. A37 TaxID=1945864 RepID=UPI00117B8049|nr:hypothetical protein [Hydrogenophaga sp. A37]
MSTQRTRAPVVWLAGLACTLGLGTAPLASAAATPAAAQRPPSKVSFIDAPSSESPEARSKRLKRECKGRPNAGACLGHTQ